MESLRVPHYMGPADRAAQGHGTAPPGVLKLLDVLKLSTMTLDAARHHASSCRLCRTHLMIPSQGVLQGWIHQLRTLAIFVGDA